MNILKDFFSFPWWWVFCVFSKLENCIRFRVPDSFSRVIDDGSFEILQLHVIKRHVSVDNKQS